MTFRPRLVDKLKGAKDTILYRNLDNKGLEGSSITSGKGKKNTPMYSPSSGQFNIASNSIGRFNKAKGGNKEKSKQSSTVSSKTSSPVDSSVSTDSATDDNVDPKKAVSLGRLRKGREDKKKFPSVTSSSSLPVTSSSNEASVSTTQKSQNRRKRTEKEG